MKSLCFLLFVVTVQGFVVEPRESVKLPAPHLVELQANDDSLKVSWSKVVSPQNSDPVLGYIVNVWELHDKIVFKYKIIDGKKVLVQETEKAKMDPNVVPTETPREIKVEGSDKSEVLVKDTKVNVQYHIRVQAYTKNERGPLSNGSGVKLLD